MPDIDSGGPDEVLRRLMRAACETMDCALTLSDIQILIRYHPCCIILTPASCEPSLVMGLELCQIWIDLFIIPDSINTLMTPLHYDASLGVRGGSNARN